MPHRIQKVDRVIEIIRGEEYCGPYATPERAYQKHPVIAKMTSSCAAYTDLQMKQVGKNTFVDDNRCNSNCPHTDCDNWLPF